MKTKLMAVLAATTMIAGAARADEIIFAHGANPGNPRYVAAEKWGEIFTACTGGASQCGNRGCANPPSIHRDSTGAARRASRNAAPTVAACTAVGQTKT